MFTGIVEEVGKIKETNPGSLVIEASTVVEDAKIGDSICVNGTCLTVISLDESGNKSEGNSIFAVDVVPETLRRTNLGNLSVGDAVNLERSMAANGRFGGHVVQGHVDGTGTIKYITEEGEAWLVEFEADPSIMRYVVEKGFIAVDGTSLTVVNCDNNSFVVTIIPHTRENTVFSQRQPGDTVNLEVDIMAKYVERFSTGNRVPLDLADEL